MADEKPRPIIVIKKKGGHAGHHGGAWKVAYADFVTALMALFIVLWLMNSTPQVKEAVSGYFKDPAGNGKLTGSTMEGKGKGAEASKDNMEELKHELEKAIENAPEFQAIKDQISLTVTSEGLRIELMETKSGMFFQSGNASATAMGVDLLRLLSEELGKLPNRLLIEGHTDATPYATVGPYTNWELSSDRANRARQVMQASGLKPSQVFQVRGYADQQLRNTNDPNDPANRRVTVIVQYVSPPAGSPPAAPKAATPAAPEKPAKPANHG